MQHTLTAASGCCPFDQLRVLPKLNCPLPSPILPPRWYGCGGSRVCRLASVVLVASVPAFIFVSFLSLKSPIAKSLQSAFELSGPDCGSQKEDIRSQMMLGGDRTSQPQRSRRCGSIKRPGAKPTTANPSTKPGSVAASAPTASTPGLSASENIAPKATNSPIFRTPSHDSSPQSMTLKPAVRHQDATLQSGLHRAARSALPTPVLLQSFFEDFVDAWDY